ncbi:unnamed protein product, partial [Vitis vinifera]
MILLGTTLKRRGILNHTGEAIFRRAWNLLAGEAHSVGLTVKGDQENAILSPLVEPSTAEVAGRIECISTSSEDEDVCPTCLEDYTPENPKIVTQCSHHFHLGCIYEWLERSQTCPVCSKVTSFYYTSSDFILNIILFQLVS